MRNLVECIKISFDNKTNTLNEGFNNRDLKAFWSWVDAMGGTEVFDLVKEGDEYEEFYAKTAEIGTTAQEFELFVSIFEDLTYKMLEVIQESDTDMYSSDGAQYASWSSVWHGQKDFEKALKTKKFVTVCDEYDGETVGYAMALDLYEDWLNKNEKDPKGFSK